MGRIQNQQKSNATLKGTITWDLSWIISNGTLILDSQGSKFILLLFTTPQLTDFLSVVWAISKQASIPQGQNSQSDASLTLNWAAISIDVAVRLEVIYDFSEEREARRHSAAVVGSSGPSLRKS
jgi:hypothetical protein